MKVRNLPIRLVTGAFVLHSGLEKWKGSTEQAAGVHGMASSAYPFLKSIPPEQFLRLLAAVETLTGTVLLAPFVPSAVAGAVLTGFSGGLLGLYARTPGLRKPGSVWPEQEGIAISKDAWMFGIGLTQIADSLSNCKEPD